MRRIGWLFILTVSIVAIVATARLIDWQSLADNHARLQEQVSAHPLLAAFTYLLAYVLTAALSLPQAAILTVAGGLLFGAAYGCALTVAGATIGATLLQVFIRSVFARSLNRQRHRIPEAVRHRLARDGFSYLLALRLVPLFPFWIVNLAAAAVDMRLSVFWPATLLGIAPASYVLSSIGEGVGSVLATGRTPDLTVLYAPRIFLPLLGLALLVLLPTLFRRRSATNV